MRWIHTQATIQRAFLVFLGLILTTPAIAAGVVVHDQAEYQDAVKNAGPGDTIVLANGEWKDFEIVFTGEGEAGKPITLTAQDKGRVIITGQSNLRLAGEHLVVSGLVFKNGHTPTSEVISFKRDSKHLANHSRVTEVVIDGFNHPERTETDYWVAIYGRHNRFDHNHLAGKSNRGVTLAVRLNSEESQQNHHRIDHNYFGHRPVLGSNGGETLRIGTSHYSLTDSFTIVENNWFERCDGEVEIISSKSGGNVFRNNVFFESRGTLTLRHGNGNLIEGNVFLGNGVDHTGGIRVINKRQTIRNNYLSGLRGYRFGSALTVMNGVPDSPINRYHQVEDAVIENNTVIDSHHIHLAAGSDAERSAVPISSVFRNNLVYNADGRDAFTVFDDISGISFSGNVTHEVKNPGLTDGFINKTVKLEKAGNGLKYPKSDQYAKVGASRDLVVTPREETGVAWYPKPVGGLQFDTGATIPLQPGSGVIEDALAEASAGDVIELAPGKYLVEKIIVIDRPITVRAAPGGTEMPVIGFERSALFEIAEGGALKIQGLHITGRNAPDMAGNSMIRTSRYSMLGNYMLEIVDSEIADLDVNHSFNVMTGARSTFADRILIDNSTFRNITGAVLELGKESDDLGLYNAEYVTISDSRFEKVGKALVVLYRGGTDESTFGPHLAVTESSFEDLGNNSRNKTGASLSLHGVQVASIHENHFLDSRPIKVMQTVGEPITVIRENHFEATPPPVVKGGPATVEDNTVTPDSAGAENSGAGSG
jgi:poly(beta-D-mannuronate) lyase